MINRLRAGRSGYGQVYLAENPAIARFSEAPVLANLTELAEAVAA